MRKTPKIAVSPVNRGLGIETFSLYLILLYNYLFFYIYTPTHLPTPYPTHTLSYYTPHFLQKIKQIPFTTASCSRIKALKGSTMRPLALFAFICFLCCVYLRFICFALQSIDWLKFVQLPICHKSIKLDKINKSGSLSTSAIHSVQLKIIPFTIVLYCFQHKQSQETEDERTAKIHDAQRDYRVGPHRRNKYIRF